MSSKTAEADSKGWLWDYVSLGVGEKKGKGGKADWVLPKNGLRACETLGTQQMGVESEHSQASNLI